MPARVVVLAPDLFGRSFVDRECARVLELWRDGAIRPALNRGLLVQYMRVLRALDVPEPAVRRWAWWWNAADKTLFLDSQPTTPGSVLDLCSWVAIGASAACVVHSGYPFSPPLVIPDSGPPWTPARAFLVP